MKLLNKKGQGSFLSGDIPAIILIVVSMGFFLSSLFLALNQFESNKQTLQMQAALVDASSSFLKENAKIRPQDIKSGSQFWTLTLEKLKQTYGVNVYVELEALDDGAPDCVPPCDNPDSPGCRTPCRAGDDPTDKDLTNVLSKRFPIAMKGESDLEIYPALVKVVVY